MFFWMKENKRRKMDHEEGEGLGKTRGYNRETSRMKCILFFLTVEWNDFIFLTKNGMS